MARKSRLRGQNCHRRYLKKLPKKPKCFFSPSLLSCPASSMTLIPRSGNHDLTLDAPFYAAHHSQWKWPRTQDVRENRRLFAESEAITYLDNEAATVYLDAPGGPHTCFRVYGSPCAPNNRDWAFRYAPASEEAEGLWDRIPPGADIVVTHTPPRGHCDTARTDDTAGCEVLLRALYRVRPMMAVFGHIHEGRGAERVRWARSPPSEGGARLTEDIETWTDPGLGNKKQSLVDVSARGGRPLANRSGLAYQTTVPKQLDGGSGDGGGSQAGSSMIYQPSGPISTSSPEASENAAGELRRKSGGAIEYRYGAPSSKSGLGLEGAAGAGTEAERSETLMVNAAFLGPHGSRTYHKPIVVDIDLPVWK
ncbi:calcineurin-like phosphoesterase [Xylariomycetidae sp. FL2044]|nr:calcineurin-like phosphoesterase [Xylariomycetidae sp. FL2044]